MLKSLVNPKTLEYKKLKEYNLSKSFPWYWCETSTWNTPSLEGHSNDGLYHHSFLERAIPERPYTKVNDNNVDKSVKVIDDILKYNNISYSLFYRIGANSAPPTESGLPNMPHEDHHYPHTNILIYLTDTHGGYTMVENEKYIGREDDVIIFQGEHYSFPPSRGRRIVLVSTFL